MAMQVYGNLVSSDATSARYEFGLDAQDPDRGTLVIPVDDPSAWYVEGRDDLPRTAALVVGKAVRLRTELGEWPAHAPVFTG